MHKGAISGLAQLTNILWESFEIADNFDTGPGTKTDIFRFFFNISVKNFGYSTLAQISFKFWGNCRHSKTKNNFITEFRFWVHARGTGGA